MVAAYCSSAVPRSFNQYSEIFNSGQDNKQERAVYYIFPFAGNLLSMMQNSFAATGAYKGISLDMQKHL